MKRRRGSASAERAKSAAESFARADGHASSAERLLRGGDCRSAADSVFAAVQEFGEGYGHFAASRPVTADLAAARVRIGVRVQKLRTAILRACVR